MICYYYYCVLVATIDPADHIQLIRDNYSFLHGNNLVELKIFYFFTVEINNYIIVDRISFSSNHF
jgi:hypothetical protein